MILTIGKDKTRKHTYIFLIALYLFALACLYSDEHIRLYYAIVCTEFIWAFLKVIISKYRINLVANSSFIWWVLCVFLMYLSVGILRTTYALFSVYYIAMHLMNTLTIVFFLIDLSLEDIEEILCKGSAWGSVFSMVFVVVNEFDIIRHGSERIGVSASGNVDVFGMYLGIMSIFCLFKIIVRQNRGYMPVYALQVGFMLLTGSKQALLYIIISYLMFIKYKYKRNLSKYFLPFLVIVGLGIAIFTVPVLYELVGHRILIMLVSFGININGIESSYSTDKRIAMITIALQLFKDHPLFGGGWGYFTHFSGFGVYSHTTYTEILVTYGLFGFVLYYFYFYKRLIVCALKQKRSEMEQLVFVLLCSIVVADIARITFSQTSLNYVIAFISWKVLRDTKKSRCLS
ncbi:MAG: O-antigen ligase family protein [Lachnospiraceae bacterium]